MELFQILSAVRGTLFFVTVLKERSKYAFYFYLLFYLFTDWVQLAVMMQFGDLLRLFNGLLEFGSL